MNVGAVKDHASAAYRFVTRLLRKNFYLVLAFVTTVYNSESPLETELRLASGKQGGRNY